MKKIHNKKILLISNTSWYIYNFRLDLLKLIVSNKYDLYVICPKDKYQNKIKNLGFKIYEWELHRNSINPIVELLSILKLLIIYLRIKPDIVHNFTIKASIYGSICSRICNTNLTINSFTGLGHLFISSQKRIKLILWILSPFIKFIFSKNNTKLIFQNQSDKNHLVNLNIAGKKNSQVIPGSGVDIKFFKPIKKKNERVLKLLFPSRLIKEKGIIELIKACKLIWEENFPIELYIAGKLDKGNRSCLNDKEINNLKRNRKIHFVGHIEDMRGIYKSCDVVVLPSWREGLSKALLEAASMEKAIITTNVPGCKEIIENMKTGLLVPKNNPLKIKECILKLYFNRNLIVDLGKAARKKVKEEFELHKINKMTINLYE